MSPLYYCSVEFDRNELPVAAHIVQHLQVEDMPAKAVLLETAHPILKSATNRCVAVIKGNETMNDLRKTGVVFVFLLPFDHRVKANALDLSEGLQPVLDWGALCSSKEAAEHWQMRSRQEDDAGKIT